MRKLYLVQISDEVIKIGSGIELESLEDYAVIEKKLVEDLDPSFDTAYNDWQNVLDTFVKRGDKLKSNIAKENIKAYINNLNCCNSCSTNHLCDNYHFAQFLLGWSCL